MTEQLIQAAAKIEAAQRALAAAQTAEHQATARANLARSDLSAAQKAFDDGILALKSDLLNAGVAKAA